MQQNSQPDAESRRYFGKYAVLGPLGQGGMARVFLAVSSGPRGVNKLLVVKELRRELASDPAAQNMFLDEARIATRLNHPNVVQTYEVVDDVSTMYLTMEYLEGQALHALMPVVQKDVSSRLLALRILADMLAGLQYVHDLCDYDGSPLGLVHRDVSPHNVFVTYDGLVKLVDFGVAKAADTSTNTATGMFKGKVRYAAPEQAVGAKLDHRADLFSAGVILWELASGRRMWGDAFDTAILVRLANGEIPQLRSVVPDIHPDLDAICTRALARDPDERYGTASAFRADLLSFIESQSTRGLLPDLGRWMSETFTKERTAARQFVDSRMQAHREAMSASGASGRVPSLLDSGEATRGTPLATAQAVLPDGSGPKKAGGVAIAAALVAVAAAAVFATTLRPQVNRAEVPRAAAAPPVPTPSVAPDPPPDPPAPSDTRLSIAADAPGAQLALDGKALGPSPYTGLRPRDGRDHVLTVTAPGYANREMVVRFDRDVELSVTLAKIPAQPVGAAVPAAPARHVSRPPAHDTPPTKSPPRRTIYEDNPYQR